MRRRSNVRNGLGWKKALAGGVAGAAALTALHQTAQKLARRPPRMDRVGLRAIARGMHALGLDPPRGRRLYTMTLVGDLLANSAYYALAALAGRRSTSAGAALGVAAGVGALALPRRMGLDDPPDSDAADNQAMTVAWYTLGGIVAGAAMARLRRRVGRAPMPGRLARIRTPNPDWRRAEDL